MKIHPAAWPVSALALLLSAGPAAAVDWSWAGGVFQPGVTAPNPLPAGDTLVLGGVGRKRIVGDLEVVNDGHWDWSGAGDIRFEDGGRLVNHGSMRRVGSTGSASMTTLGTLGGSFVNEGLFINDGAGVSLALAGGTLVNTGVFDNRSSGSFALPGGWTNQGVLAGTGDYSVGSGGLFNAGVIAPGTTDGNGIGTLRTTNSNTFTMDPAGTISIDVASAASFDFFDVAGSGFGDAFLAGTLQINCVGACALAVGDELTVMAARRSIVGSFDRVVLNGFGAGAFEVVYDLGTNTNDDFVRLRVTEATSPVPEPGVWSMMLAGAAMLAGLARRRVA